MPRYCEVCNTEFKYASELAEHLKLSSCSNFATLIKCPYCDRNDFVDEDSLNRHLTYNRKCSRADVEATDNLSILAPDKNSILAKKKQITQGSLGTFGLGAKLGDQHHMSSHQGNLVNYVDGYDMHTWHQLQTALVTDDTRKMLHLASSRMVQDESGQLHKEISVITVVPENKCHHLDVMNPSNIEKSQGSTHQSDMNKMNNDNGVDFPTEFASGQEYDADSSDDDGFVHSGSTDTGQYYEHSDDEGLHNSSHSIGAESHDSLPEEEESESSSGEEEQDNNTNNVQGNAGTDENNLPINAQPLYSNHTCHHTSPELDTLVDLYTILDRRGVANSVFDEIAKWAWLNAHTFGSKPPMKRKMVIENVYRHVRGGGYKELMTPRQEVLQLSTGRHVALTYFPLEFMITDMLSNATLMDKENLLFSNYKDPANDQLSMASQLHYGEVNSGSWWKTATRHECKGPKDILWPLIMFIDAMKVDNHAGKLKLEPITFTFSRFKRWVRNQDNAWRTWALHGRSEAASIQPR
jgi:hypothetical protein